MGLLGKSNRRNTGNTILQKMVAPKMPKKPTAGKAQASMPSMPKIPSFSRGNTRSGSSGMGGMMKTSAPAANKSSQAKKPLMATPIEPNNIGKKKVKKGPGFKNGGSAMKYKDGGCVAGAANRRRMMQEMVN
jgi:hypothetical protein